MKMSGALAILLLASSGVASQGKNGMTRTHRSHRLTSQLFAPKGLGFRISVPAKPQRIRDWIGDTDPNGYKSVDVFGSGSRRFHVAYAIVALLPSEGMLKEDGGVNNLDGLWCLIGGDDAEPASELPIRVNGLAGREYIYHFSTEAVGHVRGRVIDGGRRIFVLNYRTNTAASLNSRAAMRFFNSFKVAKAARVRSKVRLK